MNPDVTVAQLCKALADAGQFYARGIPVRLVEDAAQGGATAVKMDADSVVLTAHKLARPYAVKPGKDGAREEVDARLPKPIASMYLSVREDWRLPPLNGIASAPLLSDDGSTRSGTGYDATSGIWLEKMPEIEIERTPTKVQAERALRLLRETFGTFCFADAETIEGADGVAHVDLTRPPGQDESAFLTMLVTAVCRPSLDLAPGALLVAAETSGAGTGKGKLARCISAIAFGRQPSAVTFGGSVEELEKRLAAKLIESSPAILLDNLNGVLLRSDLLASALSERPAEIRVLGRTEMRRLHASALVVVTGNGLRVSEDLARRFIEVRLDAKTEDPESRPFYNDIVAEVAARRAELLSACLTIWRWGRLTKPARGAALGGYGQWGEWVRDPLMALGCKDPVTRVSEAKVNDPRRQRTAEIFRAWWEAHGSRAVAATDLDPAVVSVIDPHNKGRQYVVSVLQSLEGTRLAGFLMTRQKPAGHWGTSTYCLEKT